MVYGQHCSAFDNGSLLGFQRIHRITRVLKKRQRRIIVGKDRRGFIIEQKKGILYKNGKMYFTREMERKFYFILTILMLLLGLLAKTGLF